MPGGDTVPIPCTTADVYPSNCCIVGIPSFLFGAFSSAQELKRQRRRLLFNLQIDVLSVIRRLGTTGRICTHRLVRPLYFRRELVYRPNFLPLLEASGPAFAYCFLDCSCYKVVLLDAIFIWEGNLRNWRTWPEFIALSPYFG